MVSFPKINVKGLDEKLKELGKRTKNALRRGMIRLKEEVKSSDAYISKAIKLAGAGAGGILLTASLAKPANAIKKYYINIKPNLDSYVNLDIIQGMKVPSAIPLEEKFQFDNVILGIAKVDKRQIVLARAITYSGNSTWVPKNLEEYMMSNNTDTLQKVSGADAVNILLAIKSLSRKSPFFLPSNNTHIYLVANLAALWKELTTNNRFHSLVDVIENYLSPSSNKYGKRIGLVLRGNYTGKLIFVQVEEVIPFGAHNKSISISSKLKDLSTLAKVEDKEKGQSKELIWQYIPAAAKVGVLDLKLGVGFDNKMTFFPLPSNNTYVFVIETDRPLKVNSGKLVKLNSDGTAHYYAYIISKDSNIHQNPFLEDAAIAATELYLKEVYNLSIRPRVVKLSTTSSSLFLGTYKPTAGLFCSDVKVNYGKFTVYPNVGIVKYIDLNKEDGSYTDTTLNLFNAFAESVVKLAAYEPLSLTTERIKRYLKSIENKKKLIEDMIDRGVQFGSGASIYKVPPIWAADSTPDYLLDKPLSPANLKLARYLATILSNLNVKEAQQLYDAVKRYIEEANMVNIGNCN